MTAQHVIATRLHRATNRIVKSFGFSSVRYEHCSERLIRVTPIRQEYGKHGQTLPVSYTRTFRKMAEVYGTPTTQVGDSSGSWQRTIWIAGRGYELWGYVVLERNKKVTQIKFVQSIVDL